MFKILSIALDAVMAIGRTVAFKAKRFCVSLLSFFGLTFVFIAPASAAVPADVTTAITTAVADVAVVGAAVIVVMVGIKVFKWMRAAL